MWSASSHTEMGGCSLIPGEERKEEGVERDGRPALIRWAWGRGEECEAAEEDVVMRRAEAGGA